jgi:hypothetical protein
MEIFISLLIFYFYYLRIITEQYSEAISLLTTQINTEYLHNSEDLTVTPSDGMHVPQTTTNNETRKKN